MRVDFTVPEQRVDDMTMGQAATLRPDRGRVSAIRARSSASTRRSIRRRGWSRSAPRWRIPTASCARASSCACASSCRRSRTSSRCRRPPSSRAFTATTSMSSQAGGRAAARGDAGGSAAAAPAEGVQRRAGGRRRRRQRCSRRGRRRRRKPNSSWRSRSSSRSAGGRAIMIEIAKGLEPGQTVVTSGQNKLANNAPVTINNEVDPAAIALGERGRRVVNFSETLHPPAGPDDRHLDPDPAPRHPGISQHDRPRIPGGRGIGHHRHHRLSRRQRRA